MRKATGLIDGKIRAILVGEHPALTWSGKRPCPVKKGDEIGLLWMKTHFGPVAQVWIKVLAVRRGKKGEHLAEYSVRDDRPLYMRRRDGYSRSRAVSLDPTAPVTDDKALDEFKASSRLREARRREAEDSAEEAARKRDRAVRERLKLTLRGLPVEGQTMLLAAIEREITRAQNTSEAAA